MDSNTVCSNTVYLIYFMPLSVTLAVYPFYSFGFVERYCHVSNVISFLNVMNIFSTFWCFFTARRCANAV